MDAPPLAWPGGRQRNVPSVRRYRSARKGVARVQFNEQQPTSLSTVSRELPKAGLVPRQVKFEAARGWRAVDELRGEAHCGRR